MKPLDRNSLKNTNAEGTYLHGRHLIPSELTHCLRCGISRMTRAGRPPGLCMSCRGAETRIAKETPEPLATPLVRVGLIWKPAPRVARMSPEDLAWCERNAAEFKARRPVIYYTTNKKEMAA